MSEEVLADAKSIQWTDDELTMFSHIMSHIQFKANNGKAEPETGTLKKSGSDNIHDVTATALSQPSTPLLPQFKSSAASRVVLKFARGHIIFGQVEIQAELSNQSFIQEIGAHYFRNCKRIGKMQKVTTENITLQIKY